VADLDRPPANARTWNQPAGDHRTLRVRTGEPLRPPGRCQAS
jgi:hypothetical protein